MVTPGPPDPAGRDRGQAFTLEGFASAIIVLTAVLFALQAVVITPTTGGAVDRAALSQEEQEVRDVLLVGAENDDLSELVRNWNTSTKSWDDSTRSSQTGAYNSTEFAATSDFGTIVHEHFANSSGKSYNLDFITQNGSSRDVEHIVRMGGGSSESVVSASYTVTIHDEQPFTGGSGDVGDSNTNYPFRPGTDDYTVVEVQLTVW
ncbi:DUF7288 family protein [Halovivax cerinus]|uniref:Flagellin n=1 Tax=Halovivax cerinus TaxID=1487865 RepID=A0ABD5NLG3_9EURY|nr:hypothetical protein [Halovivax cerinus]